MKLDMAQGFHQVPLSEEASKKMAFVMPDRHYQYIAMPYGLACAPVVFQRLMTQILKGLPPQYIFICIDDVLIVAPTFKLHLQILQHVLDWLRYFSAERMVYLGFEISHEGLAPEQQKCEKIQEWISPETCDELSSLLSFFTYYRRFVLNYANKSAHLTDVKKATDKPFAWMEESESALLLLKQEFANAPRLAFPDFSKEFYLETDALRKGLGVCLSQRQECPGKPNRHYLHPNLIEFYLCKA